MTGLGDDVVALKGRCRSYGEGIAFRPVAEILRAAAGDVTEEQIGALLEGEPDAGAAAGYLAAAAGSSDTLASAVEVDWAVRRLLEALARRTPLVVVLEDIHWAEPALLDLLELLPDTVRDAPVLLLCLARPELLEERPRWDVSLLVEPLSADESDLLIDRLLGDTELPAPGRARVAEAAEGNALYIEQALAFLSERDAEDGDLEMPPTTKALLDARLDRLPAVERDVLERAAVMGRELWPEALTALADHDEDLGPVLASLTRKELIEPTSTTFLDDAYRFRHKLIREAAYSALTKRLRAGLHERFADWLEGRAAERDEEYDDLLGYHLEQAAQYRTELGEPDPALAARAAGHLASAGRRALARSDIPAAVGLLSRAAALAAGDDVVRSALLVDLAEAKRDGGDLSGADLALGEALELAERAGSAVAAEAARIGHLRIAFQTDSDLRVEETLPVVERAIAAFEAAGDDRELARALYVRAWISWLGCRAAEAEQALEAAIVHARRAGDERAEASALHLLVGVALFGPMPVAEGRRRCEEILETHASKLRVTASALRALAGLAAQQGRFDEAEEFMARDRSITDELGTRLTRGRGVGALRLGADACRRPVRGRGRGPARVRQPARDGRPLVGLDPRRRARADPLRTGPARRGARADRARPRRVVARRPPHADPVARAAREGARAARGDGGGRAARPGGGRARRADRLPERARDGAARPRRGPPRGRARGRGGRRRRGRGGAVRAEGERRRAGALTRPCLAGARLHRPRGAG